MPANVRFRGKAEMKWLTYKLPDKSGRWVAIERELGLITQSNRLAHRKLSVAVAQIASVGGSTPTNRPNRKAAGLA